MANLPADEAKEDIKEALLKQIVALTLENVPEYKQAEQLNLSRYAVRKMRNSDEFKSLLKDVGDQAIQTAKESFRSRMDGLSDLAYNALKKSLQEGKIEGVKTFIQVVGLAEKQEQTQQDASITIVMPGANAKPTIEVEND